jgi:hypothetical protein
MIRDLAKKESRILDTFCEVACGYSECTSMIEINGKFYLSANEFSLEKNSKPLKLVRQSIDFIKSFFINGSIEKNTLHAFVSFRNDKKQSEGKKILDLDIECERDQK